MPWKAAAAQDRIEAPVALGIVIKPVKIPSKKAELWEEGGYELWYPWHPLAKLSQDPWLEET